MSIGPAVAAFDLNKAVCLAFGGRVVEVHPDIGIACGKMVVVRLALKIGEHRAAQGVGLAAQDDYLDRLPVSGRDGVVHAVPV